MKILITGGKTATAFKLLKAFNGQQVILADYGDVPSISSTTYQFISLGQFNQDTIAHDLLNCCLDNEISHLLPLHEETLESLTKAQILFKEFDVNIIAPSMEWLATHQPSEIEEKKNWAVFLNGEILFANPPDPSLAGLVSEANLSGAFYFNTDNGKPVLSLIVA